MDNELIKFYFQLCFQINVKTCCVTTNGKQNSNRPFSDLNPHYDAFFKIKNNWVLNSFVIHLKVYVLAESDGTK